jgi:hypothetical protein
MSQLICSRVDLFLVITLIHRIVKSKIIFLLTKNKMINIPAVDMLVSINSVEQKFQI